MRARGLLLGLALLACTETTEGDGPGGSGGSSGSGGSGGSGGRAGSTGSVTCSQSCQDQTVGYAIQHTIRLLYNQNVAGTPAGNVSRTANCPLGGTALITGTTTVASNGVNMLRLVYDLTRCENSSSTYALAFSGSVRQEGSFKSGGAADAFTSLTFASDALATAGTVKLIDDPHIDHSCAVSVTFQSSGTSGGTLNGRICGRDFSSGSSSGTGGSGGGGSGGGGSGGSPVGGGSGSTGGAPPGGPGPGCPSVYEGTYFGMFAYDWQEGSGAMVRTGTDSFPLAVTLACIGGADGTVALTITQATAGDPFFGCQQGCAPRAGSVASLPMSPPTTPSNPSRAGHGLVVSFPSGAQLGTSNGPGALNVTSDGRILSSSLDPAIQGATWVAVDAANPRSFPGTTRTVRSWKSWSLSKSAR